VADSALVQNSMVTEGCVIEGEVDFSILFSNVTVEAGAVVRDHAGRAIAAIAVAGPSSRCSRGRLRELAPHVIEAARSVSGAL